MGNAAAGDEECYAALKRVAMDEFFKANGGLDFELIEGGANLSGGQCQRLALARSILYNADLYIFDEASSNIDIESETIILNTIQELKKTKTIILISHRLANVANCDKIFVMENGKIVESGTHSELMRSKNLYQKLYTYQEQLTKGL